MATVDMVKKTFTIDPDELLDIRKHALKCAVMLYKGKGDYLTNDILYMARSFEEHLTRKVSND